MSAPLGNPDTELAKVREQRAEGMHAALIFALLMIALLAAGVISLASRVAELERAHAGTKP